MYKTKTGYSSETKKNLLLGAGAIFKNFVVGTDTYETSKSKIIGATQGGNEFTAVPTVRNIQVDGILGKVADLDTIDSWDVSLTVTFLEVTKEVICAALGASKTLSDATGYDHIRPDLDFKVSDYFANITYVGTISGTTTPVIVQVKNAINMGGLTVKVEDGAEGTVEVKFEGRMKATDTEVPFDIYWPKQMTVTPDTLTVAVGSSEIATVTNGTGAITAVSSDTTKATVSVSTSAISVTGVAAGSATITVTDSNGNERYIDVTVTSGT